MVVVVVNIINLVVVGIRDLSFFRYLYYFLNGIFFDLDNFLLKKDKKVYIELEMILRNILFLVFIIGCME